MTIDLTTKVGKVKVEGVVGNSAGPRKTIEECHKVGRSPAGMIMLGSLTAEARTGNEGEVYWNDRVPNIALNSLGLPSQTPENYLPGLLELEQYGKPVVVSLAGFSVRDFHDLAAMLYCQNHYSVELNLTCPNIAGKVIFAYDFDLVRQTIQNVRRILGVEANILVKLNYHPDQRYIQQMATILVEEGIDAVALCNTVPYGLVLDSKTLKPVITPNKGLAGFSGKAIKPLVMGQVQQYRELLPPEIDIVAEGGIWTAQDLLEYFAVGASFCRIATMYAEKGARSFTQLTSDFIDLMNDRGFSTLAEIRQFATT